MFTFTAAERLRALNVTDVMSKRVINILQNQTLSDAARTFAENEISFAPVLGDHEACVGVLSATDYAKAITEASSSGTLEGDTVRRRMTNAVKSIGPQATLLEAAELMCNAHIHRLPVVRNERVVGVVSTFDIVRAVVNAIHKVKADEFVPLDF